MMTNQEILEALVYIGIVDVNDFSLKDEYFSSADFAHHRKHGKAHIYRVMIAAALIAKELGEPRLGKLAFCAAFLHDQARKDNDGDYGHGWRAAKNCFHKFDYLWDKYELSPIEREYVRAACADHSANDGHTFRKNTEVRHILKDADALDRCRFFRHGRLNPDELKYQKVSRGLIKVTEQICEPTNHTFSHEISFLEFIDRATTPKAKSKDGGYNRAYAPDVIVDIDFEQVFVFGNNSTGDSKFSTAVLARKHHGARKGVAEGLTGSSYSIPTDGGNLKEIGSHVKRFIEFAKANPNLEFLVTKIGCGGAGYPAWQIAPLFREALAVENILLPKEFVDVLKAIDEGDKKFGGIGLPDIKEIDHGRYGTVEILAMLHPNKTKNEIRKAVGLKPVQEDD